MVLILRTSKLFQIVRVSFLVVLCLRSPSELTLIMRWLLAPWRRAERREGTNYRPVLSQFSLHLCLGEDLKLNVTIAHVLRLSLARRNNRIS